jgi:hypothetical protein
MEAAIEFNWVLKLTPAQGYPGSLEEGKEYAFNKKDERAYPLATPIPLVDQDWHASALVKVTEYKVSPGKTSGRFRVIRKLPEEDSRVIDKQMHYGLK